MATTRAWESYHPTYRAQEMKLIANWLLAGESGSVVGLPGCGRSNLLGFLCHHPGAVQAYLPSHHRPLVIIEVDLDDLPSLNQATFYRVLLRSFYSIRHRFDDPLPQTIAALYQQNQAEQDPFLPQSALYDLLSQCQAQRIQLVLVLNRFDDFCQVAPPTLLTSIRGLRNRYKDTLSYIVGMRAPAAYLPNPALLGEIYELFDVYVCWVGAMSEPDARQLIAQVVPSTTTPPSESEIAAMLRLSGSFPALLRVVCHWWLTTSPHPPLPEWPRELLAERSVQHRLTKMWEGLTQEEQLTLSKVQELQTESLPPDTPDKSKDKSKKLRSLTSTLFDQHQPALEMLAAKGLCRQDEAGWRVCSTLLASYVAGIERKGLGKIWRDENTGEFYQDQTLLPDLTTLERDLLRFLLKHPRLQHTKSDLIYHVWPDEAYEEISEHSLYQVIMNLRRKIEPDPTHPCYLVTWRARRPQEGGYQFFPEGRA